MARKISCRVIASLTLGFLVWSSSLFAGERPTEINALDYPFDSESFIPLKLTTDPYFLKGIKAGRSNGLKHSALLICGGESLALGTDLEWAKPEENPYLFGYFLGYLQAFEAARTKTFVDCSAQSGSDLATGLVSAYEKLHEAIQNAIDALSAQCRIAGLQSIADDQRACQLQDLVPLDFDRRYWATVILVHGSYTLAGLEQARQNIHAAAVEKVKTRNAALAAEISKLLNKDKISAADLILVQGYVNQIQPLEALQTLPDFSF